MSALSLSFDGWASPAEGLGPGARTVLWVTGCCRGCPGCISPELQARTEGVAVHEVAAAILPAVVETGLLTLTGGEPFDQAAALSALVDTLRSDRDVEVFVYTGYTMSELKAGPEFQCLLDRCDMVMDGPYDETAPDTFVWRGSDNQELHLLSERARAAYQPLALGYWGPTRPITFERLDGFSIRLIGIPARADLEEIRSQVDSVGYRLGG